MVQQVFFFLKAFYISREPGTHKFGTSKIVHPKCAIGQLHDITFGTEPDFFSVIPGDPKIKNMGKMGDMGDIGPQQGRENHGLGCEWHVFCELSIRYFVELMDLIATYCYLLLHSNNTQLWWLQHGQRSSPETGSPGFRKNSWHLDNFRHQDPQVATHHFINMTKSQIINSNMKLVWQLIRRLSNTLRLRLDSPIFCPLRAAPSKIAVATGLKSTLKSQLLQHHVSSRVLGYTTVLICSSPRELTMFWASKHWKISPRKIMCSSFLGPGGWAQKVLLCNYWVMLSFVG